MDGNGSRSTGPQIRYGDYCLRLWPFSRCALRLLPKYRGELLLRVRPNAESVIQAGAEVPYEVHVVRFESDDDFRRFSEDDERQRVFI